MKRYRTLSGRHLTTLVAEPRDQDLLLLVAETSQSHVRVAVAVRNHIVRNNAPGEPEWSVVQGTNYGAHELAIDAAAGEQLAIEKTAAFYTSRDRAVSEPSEAAVGELGQAGSFDMLLERHVLAWAHLCRHFHVDLTDGDGISDEALQTVHLHLFHRSKPFRRTASTWMRACRRVGCTARHTAGTCSGTSSSFFPFSRSEHPPSPEPRCAIGTGDYLRRARPPGTQDSPVPCIPGSREVTGARRASGCTSTRCPAGGHRRSAICSVSHAVAYTAWQYYEATGDLAFLVDHGAEMILEIARFWSSAASYDRGRDRFVIRGVMGPDEFHTGYPGADEPGINNNNAYTNIMAAWVDPRV